MVYHQKSLESVKKIGQVGEIISVLINIGINLSKLQKPLEKTKICETIGELIPQCEDSSQQTTFKKMLEQLKNIKNS